MEPRGRMTFVDGLRGVAALVVMLPHSEFFVTLGGDHPGALRTALALGYTGVDVFFVLSGFVIAHSLHARSMGARALGNFLLRRSVRLDPPYWAGVALACAFVLARHVTGRAVTLPTGPQLAAHAFYLQRILGFEDLNVVFWTLCLELQFYAIFGLLLAALQPFVRGATVLASRAALALVPLYLASLAFPYGLVALEEEHTWFLPFWHEFLLGALTWAALDRRVPAWAWAAAAAALWGAGLWTLGPRPFVGAATATALYVAGRRDALHGSLASLARVGTISYSLYLVHVPVFLTFAALRTRVGALTLGRSVAIGFAAWVAALASAWVFHRLVEAPFVRLSNRLKRD